MKTIFFILYLLSAVVLLYYWVIVFSKLKRYRPLEFSTIPERPISIIIAAKNEAENILSCIQSLLSQDYSNFEIIIIIDHSEDATLEIIRSIDSEKVFVFNKQDGKEGKKSAIELGISKANNEYLAFIDADCETTSKSWLSEINQKFYQENSIVIGHGRFYKTNGFLNKLIRYESLINAIQYFSFSLDHRPYMGVGRNMAYTKTLYLKSKGFKNHLDINGGDDDLFVNENATESNVGILTKDSSHTISKSTETFKTYIFQKRRHLQAGTRYKSRHKVMLAIYGMCQFLFSAFLLVLLLCGFAPLWVIFVFLCKELIQVYIIRDICKQLQDKDLIKWKPLLESLYIFIITGIGISTWVWKVDRWK